MKYLKNFNILTLIIMILFLITGFVIASQNAPIKANGVKPPTVISKNKPMIKVKQNIVKTIKVKISGFAFNPKNITINKGDTVIWTNLDSMAHTVTGVGFDSGNLKQNAVFKYTFKTAGTFNYVCSYHSSMTGSVIVK